MKILLRSILICIPLAACVQDEVETIEAKIDYPPLSYQSDFDALQLESATEITDVTEAKIMLIDILARLMSVSEIGNRLSDEISEGSAPEPVLKPGARRFEILEATSETCLNDSEDSFEVEASIWNDKDNDGIHSLGDEWSYIWNDCRSQNSVFNGVKTSTGMIDPLRKNENQSSIDTEEFENYQHTLDLQVDSLNNKSAFYQQAKFVFSRELVDDNEITTLEILPDTIMGVTSGDDLYVFKVNAATLVSNDDDSTLELNLDARYFYSEADEAGYVDLATTENLIFEYDLALTNPQSTTQLLSGGLDMTGKDSEKVSLSIATDETKLKVLLGGADGESELVDQESFFNTGEFSLVNLTGLSN